MKSIYRHHSSFDQIINDRYNVHPRMICIEEQIFILTSTTVGMKEHTVRYHCRTHVGMMHITIFVCISMECRMIVIVNGHHYYSYLVVDISTNVRVK
jgi:hypothetical protein